MPDRGNAGHLKQGTQLIRERSWSHHRKRRPHQKKKRFPSQLLWFLSSVRNSSLKGIQGIWHFQPCRLHSSPMIQKASSQLMIACRTCYLWEQHSWCLVWRHIMVSCPLEEICVDLRTRSWLDRPSILMHRNTSASSCNKGWHFCGSPLPPPAICTFTLGIFDRVIPIGSIAL